MDKSNAYFEQMENKYWDDLDETSLVGKIGECERITTELQKSPIWKILIKDSEEKRRYLDDNWQDVFDEKTLTNMRVKKSAVKYILSLKERYQIELDRARAELKKRANTDTEILKDYDTE